MTTIAYDGRYIAIDSRMTSGSWISSDEFDKTVETGEWVIFWSGELHKKDQFVSDFLSGEEKTKDKQGMMAFNKITGQVFDVCVDDGLIVKTPINWVDARGSGSAHAITALDLGFDAIGAIRMAKKRDNCTGGTIRCYDTKSKKFIKVRNAN